jgi:polyphosphate kinase
LARDSNETNERLAGFDLDAAKLPKAIDKAALGSGGFPYADKLDGEAYEKRLQLLQIELVKMQGWVRSAGERVVILFEGRDAAGKGGAIKVFTQHLNPRVARTVALAKPTDTERGQWYFQRYVQHLPTRGEIAVFDRSWYNRAMVEPVNGFCTEEETAAFLREAPAFERMLVRDGIRLVKIFLDVGREMQLKRLWKRRQDPLKQWKLSPIDFEAVRQWPAYSSAIERMFAATHVPEAPWTIVFANDKRRARLAVIEHVLATLPVTGKKTTLIGKPDKRIVGRGGHFFDQDD